MSEAGGAGPGWAGQCVSPQEGPSGQRGSRGNIGSMQPRPAFQQHLPSFPQKPQILTSNVLYLGFQF